VKRSALGAGTKSLERGSTFAKPRTAVSTKRRHGNPSAIDKARAEAWAHHARSKTCAVCGSERVQGHHVVTKQQLRKVARAEGLDAGRVLWDLRNCLALCERHHAAHHSWARRLTLSFVLDHCPKVAQFARELGSDWWLEKEYPEMDDTRGQNHPSHKEVDHG
jgi:hypothetical protein